MKTKKQYYWHLTKKGIFLTAYMLDKLYAMYIAKPTSPIYKTQLIKAKKYTNPELGAYQKGEERERFLSSFRQKVVMINPDNNKVLFKYDSYYQAALAVGHGNGYGNISRAVRKDSLAYGFKWKKI